MANTNIDLVGLDFADIRSNLVNYLKNNTQFKDLDYTGSNIGVLLDLLAYNTYLNSYYTNMVASEMFLDTAQLRDSVVSHAKELNYTPRSFVSSKATITVDITPSTSVSSIVVPKYTSFTSRVGSNTYTFTTPEALVVTNSNNGVFSFTTDIFEGIPTTETFVINNGNTSQRYVLSSPTVDTTSIALTVYEDGGTVSLDYTQATELIGLDSTSKIFFVQAAENQQYEIKFGDGVFGRVPKDGSIFVVKYRSSSGELPNGATTFAPDGPIDGHTTISVTATAIAGGGAVNETVESIRFNAPRSFQSQNRAVTVADYETLLTTQFPEIQSISVYGGEEVDPPQYGRVFISVDVNNADGAPQSRKDAFFDYIKDKSPLTIQVEFVDPEFTYVKVNTNVLYNATTTTKTTADIKSLVQAAISGYNNTYLEDFKATLFYSAFCRAIDEADVSILSNDTEIILLKRYAPTLNTSVNFVVNADNALSTETGKKLEASEPHYGHTLTSSTFTYQNANCLFVDDTLGNVYIASQQADAIQIVKRIGTIDYTTGRVVISGLNISDYEGSYIEFRFKTLSKNVSSIKNHILKIDPIDVSVTVTGTVV